MGDDRYDRQLRLREVGEAGQARIGSYRARLPASSAAAHALAYLERAGVGAVEIGLDVAEPSFPHAAQFRAAASRELAEGAWIALRELRIALAQSGEPS